MLAIIELAEAAVFVLITIIWSLEEPGRCRDWRREYAEEGRVWQ